jgi:hypothetical protein
MATRRRFEATAETILRDLAATLVRMKAANAEVALGSRMSNELAGQYTRSGIGVKELQMDLAPYGAAVSFDRDGQRYRFACAKYADQRDNLRAAQLAVSLLWRVQEEYGVSEGRAAQESFERLFGGHRLALGDGATGDAWHEVLMVAPDAGMTVVRASSSERFRTDGTRCGTPKPKIIMSRPRYG